MNVVNLSTNYEDEVKLPQPRCPYCKRFLPRSHNSSMSIVDWERTNEDGTHPIIAEEVWLCGCGGIWQYKDIYKVKHP